MATASLEYAKFLSRRYIKLLDDSTPWHKARWSFTVGVIALYSLRVALVGGWYIITYALGIYILNLLIGFLSPQIDPETEIIGGDEEGASLPLSGDDEYKPFIRRLPEFKFWYSLTRASIIAFCCTFFPFLNIPVFWPILLIYFIALFFVTMKKQILHMIKYKYIPFDMGKPKFNAK